MKTNGKKNKNFNWFIVGIVIAILFAGGAAYRVAISKTEITGSRPIKLPVPLLSVPQKIGNWKGTDVPIDETIQKVAGNDDFLNRVYVNSKTNQAANIYLAYSARPRTLVGHRPEVCYTAGGWAYDDVQHGEFVTRLGIRIPCLIHKFHRPSPEIGEVIVLNYYVVNGRFSISESDFDGLGWRTPNINGDPAWYAAQIQISSMSEKSAMTLAEDIMDLLLEYLPDENGRVRAAEKESPINSQQ